MNHKHLICLLTINGMINLKMNVLIFVLQTFRASLRIFILKEIVIHIVEICPLLFLKFRFT